MFFLVRVAFYFEHFGTGSYIDLGFVPVNVPVGTEGLKKKNLGLGHANTVHARVFPMMYFLRPQSACTLVWTWSLRK